MHGCKESTPVPTNWKYFLQNRVNKISLFQLSSKAIVDASANMSQVVIYSTIIELVIVNAIQVISIIYHPVTMNKLTEIKHSSPGSCFKARAPKNFDSDC